MRKTSPDGRRRPRRIEAQARRADPGAARRRCAPRGARGASRRRRGARARRRGGWRAFSRPTSKRSGSANVAGSRLAAATETRTSSPRRIAAPARFDVAWSRTGRPSRPPAPAAATPRWRWQPARVGRHERELVGRREQVQDRVGDHPLRRLDAAEEHHRGVRDDLARARARPRRRRRRRAATSSARDRAPARWRPAGRRTPRRPASGTSPPAVTAVTAATIASYQPSTAPVSVSRSPERMRHDRQRRAGPRRHVAARPRRRARRRRSAGRPRRRPARVKRSRTACRRNGRANGARWRWCSSPSSVSMLGPTTRPVEKRGSSTVNVPASPMTCSASSRRRTSQPSSAGSHNTGARSRRRASRA